MRKNFTLIEMLIVISVIVILAAVGLKMMSEMTTKAQSEAAGTQIRKILAAMERFRGDFGAYPREFKSAATRDLTLQVTNDKDKNNLRKHLFKNSSGVSTKSPNTWSGDYLDEGDIPSALIDGDDFLDYWKEPLVYWLRFSDGKKPQKDEKDLKKRLTPELWSKGADGEADEKCLSINEYDVDLFKCLKKHEIDNDNVGGDATKTRVP